MHTLNFSLSLFVSELFITGYVTPNNNEPCDLNLVGFWS
jgi:hypothetical protein